MKLLLIDGLNLVRRIYSAIPNIREAPIDEENQNRIIQSCTQSLRRALKTHHPTHCITVFENRHKTWRHEILPAYKQNRSPTPALLNSAMGGIQDSFKQSGVSSFTLSGFEADDLIATFTTRVAEKRGHSIILSTDRLHCQLLSQYIQVYDHFSNQFLDTESVQARFFCQPGQIPEIMGLAGDASLSIPGIKSVGIKTAAKLINQFGSIQSVLENTESIPGSLGENIKNCRSDAALSYQLFQLKTDIKLGVNLKDFRVIEAFPESLPKN